MKQEFDSTIISTITVGILALLDIGVISCFSNLKIAHFKISETLAAIIGVCLVIFAYIPVRNTVKKAVRIVLKREIYDIT